MYCVVDMECTVSPGRNVCGILTSREIPNKIYPLRAMLAIDKLNSSLYTYLVLVVLVSRHHIPTNSEMSS